MSHLLTELNDRLLRFDGMSIIHPDNVADFICCGLHPSKILSPTLDEQIEQFNTQVETDEQIKVFDPSDPLTFDFNWNVPKKYLELDISEYIISVLTNRLPLLDYSESEVACAIARVDDELAEIDRRGLTEFFRTVIYIVDTLREKNIVWGVGRGSSCASYILFLIDLHKVDSLRYEIPLEEFFHD